MSADSLNKCCRRVSDFRGAPEAEISGASTRSYSNQVDNPSENEDRSLPRDASDMAREGQKLSKVSGDRQDRRVVYRSKPATQVGRGRLPRLSPIGYTVI